MTVAQLIAKLSQYPPDQDVMVLDAFNANGAPRDINFGPVERVITEIESDCCADCEDKEGQKVVLIGFGSY